MTPDANLIAEAMHLLDAGRVREITGVRVFRVDDEPRQGIHTVLLTGAGLSGVSCSCDTGRRGELCRHVAAGRLLIDREGLS